MMPKISPAVAQEVGYVNPYAVQANSLTDWMMWDLLEEVPDLVYPLSTRIFRKMPLDDSRIWSLLAAIRHPILQTSYYVDPNGAKDATVAFIAKELGLAIKGDNGGDGKKPQAKARRQNSFNWKQHVRSALTSLQYGHSVFEQSFTIEGSGTSARAHLAALAARPQRTISKWQVDRDGSLLAIMQNPPAGPVTWPEKPIPGSSLVVYRNEPDEGVWWGTSLLRPVYKNWILKNELIRLEAVAIRRNGVGVPVVNAPDATDPDPQGAGMKPYLAIARQYRGGNTAGVALPMGAQMKLLGVQGMRVDPRPAIEYHDNQIGIVGMQHVLNLNKGGSYALADIQNDPFVQAVQSVLDDLLEVANERIVETLVDLNFSIDENAPLIVADAIGSKQDAQAAALNLLVQAELLKPDPAIRAFIRQHLGAPPEDPDSIEEDEEEQPADFYPAPPELKPVVPGAPTGPDDAKNVAASTPRGRRAPGPGQEALFS